MNLIQLLVVLVVVGVILWLVNTYIPMQPPIKTIINVIVVLFVCLWLLSAFGIVGHIPVTRP
jgi:hypothetical protein